MLNTIISIVLSPLFWAPIVAILVFLTWRNYRKINRLKVLNVDSVLLMLEIPRTNDKKELAAEQMFAALHGILRDANELKNSGGVQEHLSFEIVSTAGQIRFYVWTPKVLQSFVEGQIYSQYPTVQIHTVDEDYVDNRDKHPIVYTAELGLTENEVLPIKTFENFEVDPLASITGTLAKLDPDHSEELWIQILTRPVPDSWHQKTDQWIKVLKSGIKQIKIFGIDWAWFVQAIAALSTPPSGGTNSTEPKVELSDRAKTQVAKAEEKATKLGYQVKIRIAYLGHDEINAKLNMQAVVGTFKQFNSTNLNGFKQVGGVFSKDSLNSYKMREFSDEGFILNISELASVYHLPHTSVETPNIVWATSKTAEPPAKLPLITGNPANDENISAFGLTNFRGINHQFGMLRRDRSRHVYIIGQTGAGKSGLLELFALSDVFYNQGYCIIDPHGDFAIDNLRFVPKHRVQDVIYFNPADTQYPVAFNPLEVTDATRKPNICSEVIGVLKRMFGDSWGPRLEHILRYTLLALLDRPEATLLDISRMLTDKEYRKETLSYCQDVTVLQFWKQEFGQWNDKQINESIAPVLNKVGAFTANPIIRNIIGQPHSSFNIRKIMDEGKILVVNLSKGLIGEDNAAILGSFLVTKVQLAAMSRSDIPDVANRRPFYLYVDEFQNFATDSFAVILSEARKYGLNLTVANQYVAQMTDEVRDAVFGNVGTTISFRVSADDAPVLAKQFEPTFDESDLIQLNNRNFVISMIINGEKVPAFSATSLNIPTTPQDNFNEIVQSSREKYSRPRADVEADIREAINSAEKYKQTLSDSGRQPGQGTAENKPTAPKIIMAAPRAATPRPNGPRPQFIDPKKNKPVEPKKISPDTVEGKNRPTLKDLAKLVAEKSEAPKLDINPVTPPKSQSPILPNTTPAPAPAAPKAEKPAVSSPVKQGENPNEVAAREAKINSERIQNKAGAGKAPEKEENIVGAKLEKNPFRNNERDVRNKRKKNKRKKNASTSSQEPAGSVLSPKTTIAPSRGIYASDFHDGRPGVATSQHVPEAHQSKDGFRQDVQNSNGTDEGFLSIHH